MFTIDGRDLYFALRVARLRPSRTAEASAILRGDRVQLRAGLARLALQRPPHSGTPPNCTPLNYVLREGDDRSERKAADQGTTA
jgi:hypothetical protein